MTDLSVNLNKIALLRNSRGRNYPSVIDFAGKFIALGVQGITIHPRPDERHIKYADARDLKAFLAEHPQVELNIEGFPDEVFMALIEEVRPHQCTLVPDAVNQLTSDHGWDFHQQAKFITPLIAQINDWGVRSAAFLDPDTGQLELAARSGTNRIELYTESYAKAWGSDSQAQVLAGYRQVSQLASELGVGVNAGHDLDLNNLPDFLTIPNILEVSIGHALTVECIEHGMSKTVKRYLDNCRG
jgi:pyridoxine 5-phosphate synthase